MLRASLQRLPAPQSFPFGQWCPEGTPLSGHKWHLGAQGASLKEAGAPQPGQQRKLEATDSTIQDPRCVGTESWCTCSATWDSNGSVLPSCEAVSVPGTTMASSSKDAAIARHMRETVTVTWRGGRWRAHAGGERHHFCPLILRPDSHRPGARTQTPGPESPERHAIGGNRI
eukprot:scaffold7377_cov389-Prasinococcus_capsulatus_cf.AAC.38